MLRIFQAENAEHYATCRALFLEYAAQLGHDLTFQHFADELTGLPGAYAPPTGCLLLATVHGRSAGCVALRRLNPTDCEMKRLYVRPGFRRRGLGRRLATEVIQRARQLGYQRMRLDTLAPMRAARSLYTTLGFRESTPHYHNPLPGAVFYELDLSPAPA